MSEQLVEAEIDEMPLFEQDLDEVSLLEGAIELNSLIKPTSDIQWVKSHLDEMLAELELALINVGDSSDTSIQQQKQQFAAFIEYFYHQWQFKGDHETFFDSQNTFIESVLKRRKGIPVSLGALLLYFGEKLGFPIEGVMFPSQFIVKVNWNGETSLYINPFNGEYLTKQVLRAWLIGYDGPLARIKPQDLATTDNPAVLGRWLAVTKGSLMHENDFATALECSNIALSFSPDDPFEIRDRGFIYQQLDCLHMAAEDFQYFIDNCPEDPSAEVLKVQVSLLNRGQITLH
ncbi:SirB1 family protein [Vibrio algicola]|nr:SirB1 family protein [Vibrio algicola]